MNDTDYKNMYNRAVYDGYRGQFQFLEENGEWKPCGAFWPGNTPGRSYRYLTQEELLKEQKPKLYDKNSFLAVILGDRPTWVRLTSCRDMLLVAGITDDGLRIYDVGYKSWRSLAKENWQWTQFGKVCDYNNLVWKSFTRE